MVTASTLGVALAAPLIGRIADRVGRKRVIVLSALTLGIATLLTATSTSLAALLFWRFLQGVATPGVFSVTTAYVHDEWPAGRAASAISAYVSGTIVGGFSGRVIAGFAAEHLGMALGIHRARLHQPRRSRHTLAHSCRPSAGSRIRQRPSGHDRRRGAAPAQQAAGSRVQRWFLRAVLDDRTVHVCHVPPRGATVFVGPGVDRIDLRRSIWWVPL